MRRAYECGIFFATMSALYVVGTVGGEFKMVHFSRSEIWKVQYLRLHCDWDNQLVKFLIQFIHIHLTQDLYTWRCGAPVVIVPSNHLSAGSNHFCALTCIVSSCKVSHSLNHRWLYPALTKMD